VFVAGYHIWLESHFTRQINNLQSGLEPKRFQVFSERHIAQARDTRKAKHVAIVAGHRASGIDLAAAFPATYARTNARFGIQRLSYAFRSHADHPSDLNV
jgi:hypothetical protein